MNKILKERYAWLLLNEAVLLDGILYRELDEEALKDHVGMVIKNCCVLILIGDEIRRRQ